MSKRKISLGILLVVVVITGIIVVWYYANNKRAHDAKKSGLEKNYGLSNFTNEISVNKDGTTSGDEFNADSVVPKKELLISNLKDAGYEVKQYDTVFDSGVTAERIYAVKEEHFVDITYGLRSDSLNNVFLAYEKNYNKYYLLAQNQNYIYAISDNEAFTKAGFSSLANNGIQFINHDNY